MTLTQAEKDNVVTLSKYFLGQKTCNLVTKENYGAEIKDISQTILTASAILRAVTLPDVGEMITEEEEYVLYSRLMCLCNIKTA